jgi:sulfite exporter TauE/SafE
MSVQPETERSKRRNFNSLLILANLFRFLSYFIVGLAGILTIAAVAAALVSRNGDTLLQLIAGSAGAVIYGLLLFLGSELIRLLVGIGKDISRMSGRDDVVSSRETHAPEAQERV